MTTRPMYALFALALCASFTFADDGKNDAEKQRLEVTEYALSSETEADNCVYLPHPGMDALVVKCNDPLGTVLNVLVTPSENVKVGLALVGKNNPTAQLTGKVTFYTAWAQADGVNIWVPASDMALHMALSRRIAELRNSIERFKRARDGHCKANDEDVEDDGACDAGAEERELCAERERVRDLQLQHLIDAKFHIAAAMTEDELRRSVPLPDDPRGAILVVGESMVGIETQCKLLDIACRIEAGKVVNLEVREERMYWVNDPDDGLTTTMGKSVNAARVWCADHNRKPASVVEVLALHRERPDLLGLHNYDIPGSRYADGPGQLAPHLMYDTEKDTVELRSALTNRGKDGWASVSFKR